MGKQERYIHALRYSWLNAIYDPVVALTTRERLAREAIIDQIPRSAESILDLASGTGTLSRAIGRALPAAQVHGVDGDADMVRRAERLAVKEGSGIVYTQGFAQELPYDNASFDVVTSSLFFHHLTLDKKYLALSEVSRVLKPGGVVLISDWGKPLNWFNHMGFLLVRCLDGFATTRENVEGKLPAIVKNAGFECVRVVGEFMAPLGTIALISASGAQN
jgi:ubiquinone/menaquinone biosynthesis C-methylase UbiE